MRILLFGILGIIVGCSSPESLDLTKIHSFEIFRENCEKILTLIPMNGELRYQSAKHNKNFTTFQCDIVVNTKDDYYLDSFINDELRKALTLMQFSKSITLK